MLAGLRRRRTQPFPCVNLGKEAALGLSSVGGGRPHRKPAPGGAEKRVPSAGPRPPGPAFPGLAGRGGPWAQEPGWAAVWSWNLTAVFLTWGLILDVFWPVVLVFLFTVMVVCLVINGSV